MSTTSAASSARRASGPCSATRSIAACARTTESPAWLLERDELRRRDPDRLRRRAVAAAGRGRKRGDALDRRERHAVGRVADQPVERWQLRALGARDDEELGSRSARGSAFRLGHGDVAELVAIRARQRSDDLVAGAARAVAARVAALEHEVRDDAVERETVEEVLHGEERDRVRDRAAELAVEDDADRPAIR